MYDKIKIQQEALNLIIIVVGSIILGEFFMEDRFEKKPCCGIIHREEFCVRLLCLGGSDNKNIFFIRNFILWIFFYYVK